MLMPAEWKLAPTEPAKASLSPKRGRPSYSGESVSLLYGHTWFLDMLSDVSGLRDDLVHVFEDSEQTDKVLSMAYYSMEGGKRQWKVVHPIHRAYPELHHLQDILRKQDSTETLSDKATHDRRTQSHQTDMSSTEGKDHN